MVNSVALGSRRGQFGGERQDFAYPTPTTFINECLAVNAFALNHDAENRLATATSGSAVESYSYDESNHWVEKVFGSQDYIYFYGPGGRLLSIRSVWNGTTSVVADRVYFGGLLLGSAGSMGSQDVSTLTDRLRTAESGYPYGTDIGSTSASNDQPDFATYTKDATTGFEYANQRYYSAGLGRFLTPDPLNGSGVLANPTSLNRFSYAGDDPVNQNGGSTGVAFTTGFSRWGNVNSTMTQLRSDALTYAPDGAGNSVLIQDLTTDYTGPSGNVYSQTAWAVDQYGNNTSTLTWDYRTSLPGSTPTRTLSTTYQNNCSSPWAVCCSGRLSVGEEGGQDQIGKAMNRGHLS